MVLTIEKVNEATRDEFIRSFGTIVEHHSQCTEAVYEKRPFLSIKDLIQHFHDYLDSISIEEKEEILKKHPMLGSKTEMTKFSVIEQKNAGLDRLNLPDASNVAEWNVRYFEKFEFPFIICVKENSKNMILEEMKKRCSNTRENEILNGIQEVKKIVKHRLETLFLK